MSESAEAIKRRMEKQRRRIRAAARAKARSSHYVFVLVIFTGMVLVVPRYPGILVFIAPPFAVLLAFALGAGFWHLPAIRSWHIRTLGRPPSFWHSLITGGALLGLSLWVAIVLTDPTRGGPW